MTEKFIIRLMHAVIALRQGPTNRLETAKDKAYLQGLVDANHALGGIGDASMWAFKAYDVLVPKIGPYPPLSSGNQDRKTYERAFVEHYCYFAGVELPKAS